MCRKSKIRSGGLVCLFSFALVLSLAGSASAELVGYWTFDEGSGTVAHDSSGSGNDGTLQDDPTVVDGQSGLALAFEGSRVAIGASDSLPADLFQGSFTLAAWINPKRTGNTWQQILRSIRADDSSNDTLFINNDGRLSWRGFVGGTWTALCETAPDVFPADQWTHFAVVGDGTNFRIYVNGALSQESAFQTTDGTNATYYIGGNPTAVGESYAGMVDDVRIYNHALLAAEITKLAARPRAWNPVPDDGAVYEGRWVTCQWTAGDFAASHDIYFGDNFADVDAGAGDTFVGNVPLKTKYLVVGLGMAGDPYPDGLVPGTTYYWRIDEVNDLDPDSPWRGKIWSFSIPSSKALEPDPPDGVKFVDPGKQLSWTAGFEAALHQVYFGENFEDVEAGTPDTTKTQGPTASYNPGPLANDTVYYWRVDELDTSDATHTGDVWSFRTVPEISITDPNLLAWWKLDEGYGTTTIDWSGHGHDGTLANGAQWVAGYDGAALQFDGTDDHVNLGAPSELYLPENYTYVAWFKVGRDINGDSGPQYLLCIGSRSDLVFGVEDGVGVNGDLSLHYYDTVPGFHAVGVGQTVWSSDEWHMVAGTKDSATGHKIYLDGELMNSDTNTNNDNYNTTRMISLGARAWTGHQYYEGAIDDVRIYDKALTADEIKQIMRIDPLRAWNPSPANGSVPAIHEAVPLSWSPGDMASQHDVYFGTDRDAVENADASDTTGVYRGPQGAASYTPPEGVEWGGGPYYWRIDERNTDGTVSEGRVWSFTVADFLSIDNFEDYLGDEVPVTEQIWGVWRDGLGYGAVAAPPYYPGNGTGSEVGDVATTSYTEESITHDGSAKSMPYVYNNNKPDKFKYSEAARTLPAGRRDWSAEGVKALSLWFMGYPASTGSLTIAGNTYTMTGSGADIWNIGPGVGEYGDEFHFAYKQLTGPGTIIARVDSVQATHDWAKAGVMIRETLEPGSKHAFACVTPASGVSAQGRPDTGAASFSTTQAGIAAPHWVKLDRDAAGNFTVHHSADGSSWQFVQGATSQTIAMSPSVYIGLALTSHDAALTCEAVFSGVQISGNLTGQWMHQDIGIESNAAEQMYVAIANNTGQPAVVYHDDPNAAQIDTWTEWNIDLKDFQDKGINLADVNSIAIGFGDRDNPQVGGWGKMYFDDIALYRARFIPELVTFSAGDLSRNGVVDFDDIAVMAADWLNQGGDGLWYEYCEGQWSLLPDFDIAATAEQGVVNNFDIGVRNQNDNFSLRFSGRINIAAAGDYTFYTTSDDGSQLFIDGALVVDNDGLHGAVEQSGVVTLTAGLHDIVATMFELGGAESLLVEYEGPGITRGPIPDDVLSLPAPVSDLNQDGAVDFRDYAVLADEWGRETLWPEW